MLDRLMASFSDVCGREGASAFCLVGSIDTIHIIVAFTGWKDASVEV